MEKVILGICPKCGGNIVGGKYGPYCEEKCGMKLSMAFGKELTEAQVQSLLEGKKTLIKGFVSKTKGVSYDMYLTVTGTEEYTYVRKSDGVEVTGTRWTFDREFPERKDGKGKEKKEEPVQGTAETETTEEVAGDTTDETVEENTSDDTEDSSFAFNG